jgi:hypothetical protein
MMFSSGVTARRTEKGATLGRGTPPQQALTALGEASSGVWTMQNGPVRAVGLPKRHFRQGQLLFLSLFFSDWS